MNLNRVVRSSEVMTALHQDEGVLIQTDQGANFSFFPWQPIATGDSEMQIFLGRVYPTNAKGLTTSDKPKIARLVIGQVQTKLELIRRLRLDFEKSTVDKIKVGPNIGGIRSCRNIQMKLIFVGEDGEVELVIPDSMSGFYHEDSLGFLFDIPSLEHLQKVTSDKEIDRLWAGAFWEITERIVSFLIEDRLKKDDAAYIGFEVR
jgi:hypothetical protein